jgi:uncharacterized protein YifE (UPF0438 family)
MFSKHEVFPRKREEVITKSGSMSKDLENIIEQYETTNEQLKIFKRRKSPVKTFKRMELSKRILEHKDVKAMYMSHMNKSISDESEEFEDDKDKLSPRNKKLELLSE